MPRRFVNGYQYFGGTYWFYLQGWSSDLKMEAICPSETLVSTLTVMTTRKTSTDSFTVPSSLYNNAQWRRKPVYNMNKRTHRACQGCMSFDPGLKLGGCLSVFFLKIWNFIKLMTPGSWPCCPMGKVTLLLILSLSFASSLSAVIKITL
jgi:hypothetical protein